MRNNQPVTQQEYKFPDHYRLITTTDKRGVITYCNREFAEVSGFSEKELLGSNHNLVRHPDMPPAVFKEMWKTLENGNIWMGLVKNRRTNGDHYWVSAFVTPVYEDGQISGYESVRVPASHGEVSRAESLYKRLNAKKSAQTISSVISRYSQRIVPIVIPGLLTGALLFWLSGAVAAVIAVAGFIAATLWQAMRTESDWGKILEISPESYADPLVAQTYFADTGNRARAKLVLICELAKSRTALTRIGDSSSGLDQIADDTHSQAESTSSAIVQQNQATQAIASAVTQMSQAIHEVAERVEMNAESARVASQNVEAGNRRAEDSLQAIHELKGAVGTISETVRELAQSTSDIGEAASIISSIAEQTNLLALNAAIEAARAGEQGRGFAVVADEVRSLASKTRQSTDKIHNIIMALAERSERAVKVSDEGLASAQRGTEIVEETRKALAEINDAVGGIANQTIEMSSAVEQQSSVAEHINKQISEIAEGAKETQRSAEMSLESSHKLRKTINMVHSVIIRFSSKSKH